MHDTRSESRFRFSTPIIGAGFRAPCVFSFRSRSLVPLPIPFPSSLSSPIYPHLLPSISLRSIGPEIKIRGLGERCRGPSRNRIWYILASKYAIWRQQYFHHGLYGSTSCCISHGPSQWERAIFDPPQLGDPSTDFHET